MSGVLLWNFFVSGFFLGVTTCALYCGSILAPFLLDKEITARQAIFRFFIFHAGKLVAYVLLGGLVGYSSHFIPVLRDSKLVPGAGAAFFFALGILNFTISDRKRKKLLGGPLVGTGFLIGFLPCGPFLAFLFYLAYVANTAAKGAIGGFLFGLGNALNPIILISPFFPKIGTLLQVLCRRPVYFKLIVSCVFFFWSASLLQKVFI